MLLFSFSSVDAEKWEAFVKAFGTPGDETSQVVLGVDQPDPNANSPVPDGAVAAAGDPGSTELPQDFDQLYQYLEQYVNNSENAGSIEVSKNGDSVVYIRFQDDIFIISINGHTAQVDMPNYAVSDWMLSGERASSVAIYFEEEKGIDPLKLRPMGYGKNYPIASNDTPEGRRKNRRVDMAIVKDTGEAISGGMEEVLNSLFDPSSFPATGGVDDLLTPDSSEASTHKQGNEPESNGEGV